MQSLLHFFKPAEIVCGSNSGIFWNLYHGIQCDNGNEIHIQGLPDLLKIVGNVIQILIQFAGALAVIFIIVGGIYFVTASGDPTRLKRAKEILTQAITGLIVVLVAFAAVNFIASGF